jgi:hypothetical protein
MPTSFFIDSIFVFYGGRVFQQTVGIPMGANCAPLLADLFLYSYDEHVDDISFRELFGRIRVVFLQNKT